MSDLTDSFENFLAEISASLTSSSGEAALRRINTERILRLVLEEIVQERHDLQIRILSDTRIAGETGADILMQIDDYDIRLEILDALDNQFNLEHDQIQRFRTIFEENPSTETIILTWTTEELRSIQLTLNQIDQIYSHPNQIEIYLNSAQPLREVIKEILESRVKVWKKMLPTLQGREMSVTDIRKLFEGHFHKCLEDERNRPFKLDEKKAAAASLSEKEASTLFNAILDFALTGESTEVLAKRLSRLPKRGEK